MAESNGSFGGKVAFVTGAGSGIGGAAALGFAREGANVVAADLSVESNQAVEAFGRVDAAFNNAGVEQPSQRCLPRHHRHRDDAAVHRGPPPPGGTG
jgi:NAD(P)-dependent dehydrogenase (short-subunit alcohol dehydrogenase family)